jgi:hypothetical protein
VDHDICISRVCSTYIGTIALRDDIYTDTHLCHSSTQAHVTGIGAHGPEENHICWWWLWLGAFDIAPRLLLAEQLALVHLDLHSPTRQRLLSDAPSRTPQNAQHPPRNSHEDRRHGQDHHCHCAFLAASASASASAPPSPLLSRDSSGLRAEVNGGIGVAVYARATALTRS